MNLNFVKDLFSLKPKYRRIEIESSFEFLMTEDCVRAICECIEPEKERGHEGISYLYGRTNGFTTLAVGAISPESSTTTGSFSVPTVEMAKLVKGIRANGLQLVSQLHTHPRKAYHSEGDIEGLKLVCNGYVSVVLPEYGNYLPSFEGAVFYFYRRGNGFKELEPQNIKIIPKRLL
jgi:proteasome lid subunit RPN8/RPN11